MLTMVTIETDIEINRPSDEVFAFVADQTNAPRWQRDLHEVRRLTDGPLRAGTEHVFVRRFAGRRLESRNRFTAYEEGRRVAFEFPDGWVSGDASYAVEPLASGRTRLHSRVSLRFPGPTRLATPLLRRVIARDARRDDAALKSLLEAR